MNFKIKNQKRKRKMLRSKKKR